MEFIGSGFKQMHTTYNDSVADLVPERLHWRTNCKGCPIAFVLQGVRTEDNIVQLCCSVRERPAEAASGAFS
jgi:hypothetical protein